MLNKIIRAACIQQKLCSDKCIAKFNFARSVSSVYYHRYIVSPNGSYLQLAVCVRLLNFMQFDWRKEGLFLEKAERFLRFK